jgi:alkylation response protein AidB-like acyl-CoA dehydrogenase
MTTLTNERGTAAFASAARFRIVFDEIVELARATLRDGVPATSDPVVRRQLAQFHVELEMMKYTSYLVFSKILKGGDPGPEGSISKLTWSELNQRMTEFVVGFRVPPASWSRFAARGAFGALAASFFALAREYDRGGDVGDSAQHYRRARAGDAAEPLASA